MKNNSETVITSSSAAEVVVRKLKSAQLGKNCS